MWRGSTLAVKHARREDAGAYLCIANNGVPPSVSKRVRLNVRCELLQFVLECMTRVASQDAVCASCLAYLRVGLLPECCF